MISKAHLREFMTDRWLARAEAGQLWITGEISEDFAITAIHIIENLDVPLDVYVCSEGGSLIGCLMLYDAIQRCGGATGHATGYVWSGAVLPYLACDRRLMALHTDVVVHAPISDAPSEETMPDTECRLAYWKSTVRDFCQIMADRTSEPLEFWEDAMLRRSSDLHLSAADALRHGIVHDWWVREEPEAVRSLVTYIEEDPHAN